MSLKGSKIFLLTYQTFSLGLLRPFAVSFCLCTTEETHSASWYPAISSSFFFNLIWFCRFYSTKSKLFLYFYIFWNLLYILFWKFAACSFPIFHWSKTPLLLYFEKKSHMIHQNSRALSDILKIIYGSS